MNALKRTLSKFYYEFLTESNKKKVSISQWALHFNVNFVNFTTASHNQFKEEKISLDIYQSILSKKKNQILWTPWTHNCTKSDLIKHRPQKGWNKMSNEIMMIFIYFNLVLWVWDRTINLYKSRCHTKNRVKKEKKKS